MKKQAKEEEQIPEEEVAEATEEKETEENLMDTMEKEVEAEETVKAETAPAEEKEAAKPRKKKKEAEEVVEERTYTIPLGKALIMPPRRRAPRAMRMIRAFIVKHMKVPTRAEEEDEEAPKLTLTNELNERIWGRGIEKPPRKIRVRATKDKEGNVTVHLAESE
jgi:large subunit ribosomal protein L31e